MVNRNGGTGKLGKVPPSTDETKIAIVLFPARISQQRGVEFALNIK